MSARLNSFQKTMLQWNALHPYNAVHAAELRGQPDLPRLQSALDHVVGARGLARVEFDAAGHFRRYPDAPAQCELQVREDGGCPTSLAAEIERELNRRFEISGPFCPVRFMVLRRADSFFLLLTYFHALADAYSAVRLLFEIAAVYAPGPVIAPSPPSAGELEPGARPLRRRALATLHKLLGLPSELRQLRQAHRVDYADPDDLTNGFRLFALAPEDLSRALGLARDWKVTVNDLLMAAMLQALAPAAASRLKSARRRHLAIGCIVSLRRDLAPAERDAFGLQLGSFTVTHAVLEHGSLRDLARDLQVQTARIKRRRLYLATPVNLAIGRLAFRFFSPRHQRRFYAKNHPLMGGITNMNLNSLGTVRGAAAPLDYVRGVSTGPATPLVLSATTTGGRLNLGVSFRRTVFSADSIAGFEQRFRAALRGAGGDP